MTMIAGWQGKLRINAAVFTYGDVSFEGQVDNLRTTNSEGYGGLTANPGVHTSISGNGWMTATWSAVSFDPADNVFLAPRTLAAGSFYTLQWFPAGLAGVSWYCPSFHILRITHRGPVTGLSPVDVAGEGNGQWSYPFA